MNHTYIDEQHVIDRYVRGTLPADEAARFEEHYLSCQDCLDQLDLAEAMKRGFQRAAGQDAARVVASRQLALVAWLTRLSRSRQAAVLAMALLVAVLLPWGLAERRMADRERELAQERSALEQGAKETGKLRAELEASQRDRDRERKARESADEQLKKAREPQGNIPILSLGVERGGPGEDLPIVHLPSPPSWILLSLSIEPPHPPPSSYQVILRDAGGREVWRGDGLRVDDHGYLNLNLHSSMLALGDTTFVVEGLTPGRKPVPAGRFSFRVLPPG
jgi:putative zinc finger protein